MWKFLLLALSLSLYLTLSVAEEVDPPVTNITICSVPFKVRGELSAIEEVARHIDPVLCVDCCTPFYNATNSVYKLSQIYGAGVIAGLHVLVREGQIGLLALVSPSHPTIITIGYNGTDGGLAAFFYPFSIPEATNPTFHALERSKYDALTAEIEKQKAAVLERTKKAETKPKAKPREPVKKEEEVEELNLDEEEEEEDTPPPPPPPRRKKTSGGSVKKEL